MRKGLDIALDSVKKQQDVILAAQILAVSFAFSVERMLAQKRIELVEEGLRIIGANTNENMQYLQVVLRR
jgi:hypothetical protein